MKYRFNWSRFVLLWVSFVGLAYLFFIFDGVEGALGGLLAAVYGFAAGFLADKFSREPVPVKVKSDGS